VGGCVGFAMVESLENPDPQIPAAVSVLCLYVCVCVDCERFAYFSGYLDPLHTGSLSPLSL